MNVPRHMEITASLLAGYRFDDGSLLEVDAAGDYRITDASGNVIAETVDTQAGEGQGLRFGTLPEDYGEIIDDLASFLQHDGTLLEYMEDVSDDWSHLEGDLIFSMEIAEWARDHQDELSLLASYREDKRLGEGFFAEEDE